jgi:hypothetical protein
MSKTFGLAAVAAACFAAALGLAPDGAEHPATAPFWQLHGAAPQAGEAAIAAALRTDVRPPADRPLLFAAR